MEPVDRETCVEVFRRLEDFVDRELSPEETKMVSDHLAICEVCGREFRFEERLLDKIKAVMRRIQAPSDLMARIAKGLRASDENNSGG